MNSRDKIAGVQSCCGEASTGQAAAQQAQGTLGAKAARPEKDCRVQAITKAEEEKLLAERHDWNRKQIGASIHVMGPSFAVAIDSMQGQIFAAMHNNGFWEGSQDNFASKTALVHSEVSELLEANRNDIFSDDKIPSFAGEEAEAADILIRLLDMAGRYGWRLGEAVVAKMQVNLNRPYKHGKLY